MANPRSIEVKVGMLILIAVGILTGFVVVMGGLSFQPTYRLFVDFDNPGGVQPGAPVKVAGVNVGKIKEIEFRGNLDPGPGGKRQSLIRLSISIEKRYQKTIHDNALFFVTSQGILGEQYLAIDPGTPDRPHVAEDTVMRGLDPPRLDLVLAEGYELLHTTIAFIRDNKQDLTDTLTSLKKTLKGTGDFFDKNKDRIDRIVANLEQITVDTDELVRTTRTKYVDSPQVARIINNIDNASAAIARDSEPLLHDARQSLANLNRVSGTVGSPEEQARIRQAIHDISEITAKAKVAANDAQQIVAHIKKGDGSVGALVMDEQIYDDLQEMVRDLKHNPWKFFWRE
ncbi:MAG: MCE family protein [Deltaproteobacteria bacterium]|nr:MCE family protein [Deltaproteobacteria bacterium]